MDTSFDLVALLTRKGHKIRPAQFVSVAGGIQRRLETNIRNRKSSRLSIFDRTRNITKCGSPRAPALSDTEQKALHRMQQLEKWKEEKDKKKMQATSQKKKPFVLGTSQRQTFGPPPLLPKPIPSTSGRVTRSQSRQKLEPKPTNTQTKSFAPSNATFKPSIFLDTEVPKLAPVNKKKAIKSESIITFQPVLRKNVQKGTRPATRTTRAKPVANKLVAESKTRIPNEKTKVNAKTSKITLQKPPLLKQQAFESSSSSETEQPKLGKCSSIDTQLIDNATVIQDLGTVSFSPQDELSTPRNKVPRSESNSEEKLRSPESIGPFTPQEIVDEVKNIRPCVTMSRGKDNARKEMKKKLDEGLLDIDNGNMDSVNHLRRQLDSEIARLTAMCETWDLITEQTAIPEPVLALVRTAVGQANLLMSKKFQQFAELLESCENPKPGTMKITPTDLQGFWDMVFMQVENIDMRFKDLEELRLRNWIEEQKPLAKKVVAKPAARKPVVKPSGGPSRLREAIAAARKAKKEQESKSEHSGSGTSEPTASPETKVFEAGFFRVSSPQRRSPGPATPGTPGYKPSLLKSVLSSEAKKSVTKRISTSFAILRATQISKDIEGVYPLLQTPNVTPVDLTATPTRSILKPNNSISTNKTEQAKKVLFETDEPSSSNSFTSCDLDPGVAPLPADDKENIDTPNKEATPRKSRYSRLSDRIAPVMTRSRSKSEQTPHAEAPANKEVKKRSTRKSEALQETETPKRSLRRRKSAAVL